MIDKKQKNILLVEDEIMIALSEKNQLENIGYNIIHATSGEDALNFALNNPLIDLILMDINLSTEMDGTQAAELILKKKDIPILFLSSHIEQNIVEKTEKITSYGYVVKDSSITVLNASIKMAFKLFEAKEKEKTKEIALKQNEKDNRKFFEEHSAIKLLINLDNGKIYNANYSAIKFYGYSLNNLRKMNFQDIIILPAAKYQDFINQIIKNEETFFEQKHKTSDGTLKDVEVFTAKIKMGKKYYLHSIIHDITNRKKIENELSESESRFRSVFEQSPVGSVFIDMNKQIIRCNKAFSIFLGYNESELIGKTIKDITYPDDADLGMKEMQQITTGQLENYSIEKRYVKKDGSVIWGEINISLVRDTNGNPLYFLPVIKDITERKLAEKEIHKQLAEKETLLKEVHHRIKNNISSIESLLSLQLQSISNPEAVSSLKDAISRISSMRILYDKLLISEYYHEISIKNYVESLIDATIVLFPNYSDISIDKKIDDFFLSAKKTFSLGIIINELLTNTMKYAFKRENKKWLISIKTKVNQNQVTLIIQDNGIGLPKDFNIKESKGFGLMLVGILCEQLG